MESHPILRRALGLRQQVPQQTLPNTRCMPASSCPGEPGSPADRFPGCVKAITSQLRSLVWKLTVTEFSRYWNSRVYAAPHAGRRRPRFHPAAGESTARKRRDQSQAEGEQHTLISKLERTPGRCQGRAGGAQWLSWGRPLLGQLEGRRAPEQRAAAPQAQKDGAPGDRSAALHAACSLLRERLTHDQASSLQAARITARATVAGHGLTTQQVSFRDPLGQCSLSRNCLPRHCVTSDRAWLGNSARQF